MNDLVFKYAYGQDTQSSKSALKGLLETFLDVKIKNTNTPNRNIKSKDSRFDIVAKLDNHTMIDVEMQMESTNDSLPNRFESYLSKMLSNQDLKGKMYRALKPCYVLVFLDTNIYDDDHMIKNYEFKSQYNTSLSPNTLSHIITVEMKKLKMSDEMSLKEDYVYYLKNCQNAKSDSKIKSILKSEEAIRMADNRLNEITDEYWQTLNREFDEMKKNENEVREKYYQDMYRKEGIELGRKEGIALGREEERTLGIAEGKVEGRTEGITETIRAFSKAMSIEAIASALRKDVSEIEDILKKDI